MGQVTAAHVELAAAKLEAEREIGMRVRVIKATPRYKIRERRWHKRNLKAAMECWDERLQVLWLAVASDKP